MPDEDLLNSTELGRNPSSVAAAPRQRNAISSPPSQDRLARSLADNVDETSSLLEHSGTQANYSLSPTLSFRTPRGALTRRSTGLAGGHRQRRARSRATPASAGGSRRGPQFSLSSSWPDARSFGLDTSSIVIPSDERLWYDQFTTIDWMQDNIRDAERQKTLAALPGIRGQIIIAWQSAESWLISALIGALVALMAFTIDVVEPWLFDAKFGYCTTNWRLPQRSCCAGQITCETWTTWGQYFRLQGDRRDFVEYAIYVALTVVLASLACMLAMRVKLRVPLNMSSMRMDDDLVTFNNPLGDSKVSDEGIARPHTLTYPATGSGVAEVRVILSGFVLHGYLGTATLFVKGVSLILSVAAGLSLGKEGPFVHMACAIANIVSRTSSKFRNNDGKRREMLSAGAASGVAVAFGAPISGVLFSLEEVSYYFPSKTLFRTFFASIVAAVSLKFLNPYGTSKIVLFQIHYTQDWRAFELVLFLLLGAVGGALGALFIKATRLWAKHFRSFRPIKNNPLLEVAVIALITGLATFSNKYTRKPVTELMLELSSDCRKQKEVNTGLCPLRDDIPAELSHLAVAMFLKAALTTITFGIKVPAGIYIPSMILGGLVGRFVGHTVQYAIMTLAPSSTIFGSCGINGNPESCVVPGVYALVAAAATMCGVTRLTVTIAVIFFELSGSLDHVLPFSIAVLAAKWTSDAIEPLSIYDLLTETNDYPFLDNKSRPKTMTGTLADITTHYHGRRAIDVSDTAYIWASVLRTKLDFLYEKGEFDGGLPILRDDILVGLVPAPDLEFTLDRISEERANEEDFECLMISTDAASPVWGFDGVRERGGDLSGIVNPAPIALDINSSMELVYECFVKLGLRNICVLKEGKYFGMVHKKAFVKHVRELGH